MSDLWFTQEHQNLASINLYIKNITKKSITYSESFKIHAINEYAKGKLHSRFLKRLTYYFKEVQIALMGEKHGRKSSANPKPSNIALEAHLIVAECNLTEISKSGYYINHSYKDKI